MVRQGILSFGLTLCLLAGVNAEPTVKEISPPDTGAGIVTARGPHRLLVDTEAPSNGLLLVTLGGTNSKPSDLGAIGDLAGRLGYKVAALDYPNSVISTKAREVGFPDGFTEFREEVVVGTPVSPIVEVDATNSIENRLLALLMSGDTDFAEFVQEGEVRWDKIVVAGHSQGSGHAAYLGKRHRLQAVLLFAGPQDTGARGVSPWLSLAGATPPESFLALLHRNDFFDCSKQLEAMEKLREQPEEQFGADVIVLNRETKDAHMMVIQPECEPEWKQLLIETMTRKQVEREKPLSH